MATKKSPENTMQNLTVEAQANGQVTETPIVMMTVADAEQLYELYRNIEMADTHFHTCQSEQFRQHMRGVYKARNVSAAFVKLNEAINAAKGE